MGRIIGTLKLVAFAAAVKLAQIVFGALSKIPLIGGIFAVISSVLNIVFYVLLAVLALMIILRIIKLIRRLLRKRKRSDDRVTEFHGIKDD